MYVSLTAPDTFHAKGVPTKMTAIDSAVTLRSIQIHHFYRQHPEEAEKSNLVGGSIRGRWEILADGSPPTTAAAVHVQLDGLNQMSEIDASLSRRD